MTDRSSLERAKLPLSFWERLFHRHDWAVRSAPVTDEKKAKMRDWIGLDPHAEFYRRCRACNQIQMLDIDGWCDPIFRDDVEDLHKKFDSLK